MKKIKIGICGAGKFARHFIPLFQAHPFVEEVVLADLFPDRLKEIASRYGIRRIVSSLEDLCKSDVDAIGIFSQRWMHGPQAVQALKSGKHVYSAVPAGVTLEELSALVETVKQTGLTYMMGETSYYYPSAIYCRERFKKGDMGHFVYGEGEYYHDMTHGFYESFKHSGGADWKKHAGLPPMFYPTHSVSMISSITGARMTQVSCLGYVDQHEDGVFRRDVNMWQNVFSNQTALFRSSDGGMVRTNEFRRIGQKGGRSVRLSFYGTEGGYEEQSNGAIWVSRVADPENVEDLVHCKGMLGKNKSEKVDGVDEGLREDFAEGFAKVHPKEKLPKEFYGKINGHYGSHQFLVNDFVCACVSGRMPPNNVWDAVRYTAPGLVAHQSSLREGELMKIPDFGESPVSPDVSLFTDLTQSSVETSEFAKVEA